MGKTKSCGVIVLFRPCFSLVKSWPGTSGRSLVAEFKCSDFVFLVCSLYAPNRNPDRDDFLIECADLVDPSVPTLLCGDFNTVFLLDPALGIIRRKALLQCLLCFLNVVFPISGVWCIPRSLALLGLGLMALSLPVST